MVVRKLCQVLMKDKNVHYEWLGVLPLLHVIKIKNFTAGTPVKLPYTETEVYSKLFCGLEAQDLLNGFVVKANHMDR